MNKMATVSPYQSIITLNINVLNSSIERHRVAEWIKIKTKTQYYAACKMVTVDLRTFGLKRSDEKRYCK
jgi:hypothetical protein